MSKLSKRTRRLTRHINLVLPYGNQPLVHNEAVRLRKRFLRAQAKFRVLNRDLKRIGNAMTQVGTASSEAFRRFGDLMAAAAREES